MQSKGCYICNTELPEKFFSLFLFCFIAIYLLRNKKPKNQASIRQDRQWNLSEHNYAGDKMNAAIRINCTGIGVESVF